MSITSHMKKILTFMSYWLTSCFCMAFYFPTCFCICYVFGPKSQSCSQLSLSPFLCGGNKLKGDMKLLGSNVAVRTVDAFHSFPSEWGPRRTPVVYAEAEHAGARTRQMGRKRAGCRGSELTVGRAELQAPVGSLGMMAAQRSSPAGRRGAGNAMKVTGQARCGLGSLPDAIRAPSRGLCVCSRGSVQRGRGGSQAGGPREAREGGAFLRSQEQRSWENRELNRGRSEATS